MQRLVLTLVLVTSGAISAEPLKNPPPQAVVNTERETVQVLADPNTTPLRVIITVGRPIPRGTGGLASLERISYQDIQDVRIVSIAGESVAYSPGISGGISNAGTAYFNLAYHLTNPQDFQVLGRVTFKYREHEYSFDVSRVFSDAEIREATLAIQESRATQ